MGWDITYHPVKHDELEHVYFKTLSDVEHCNALAQEFELDEFYANRLKETSLEIPKFCQERPFNKGHAFCIAIRLGFLRKYYYVRGSAFSFLIEDETMAKYVGDWTDIIPENYYQGIFENRLEENYCGGVYLPYDSLKALKDDYHSDPKVKSIMDEEFSHGRLAVFWKAVDDAIDKGFGLIEAAEVITPDPMDLNNSQCYSNLFNCDQDGAFLYAEAAQQQIAEMMAQMEAEKNEQQQAQADTQSKPSFFRRLFGKKD